MIKKIFIETTKYFLIIFLIIILLFPLYYLIVISLKSDESIKNNDFSPVLKEFNFTNFSFVKEKEFWNAFFISFSAILILIFIRILLYFSFAWGMILLNKKIQRFFYLILIFFSLIPEFTLFLSLKLVLSNLNFINNLDLFNLTTNSIFSIFLLFNLISFLEKSKNKINIYGKLDNLKKYEKFYFIIWNDIKGLILLLVIFTSINMWNSYLWPNFLFINNDKETISIWFRNLGNRSFGFNLINIQIAGSIISIVFPLIIYSLFSKKISKNIF
ncbi:ABC transporter permease family protein [[Mycoplasma] collis]|uniref:carbohydrate ABC transporter permease n=1 Tax=[Mycoplasma] collis TaxID=2127 RepID=UPI00051C1C0A|nr:carbohydrate ABC transporter permease [[Mycoplasma] collis]